MIQVDLRPETEARLAVEAQVQGVEMEEFARSVIERAVSALGSAGDALRTREEISAWLDSLAQFSDKIPFIASETFSREWLYQDHD